MTEDQLSICAYYAITHSKSYSEFCESRRRPPPFHTALRWVKVHWDEVHQWVRDTVERIEMLK